MWERWGFFRSLSVPPYVFLHYTRSAFRCLKTNSTSSHSLILDTIVVRTNTHNTHSVLCLLLCARSNFSLHMRSVKSIVSYFCLLPVMLNSIQKFATRYWWGKNRIERGRWKCTARASNAKLPARKPSRCIDMKRHCHSQCCRIFPLQQIQYFYFNHINGIFYSPWNRHPNWWFRLLHLKFVVNCLEHTVNCSRSHLYIWEALFGWVPRIFFSLSTPQ